MTAPLRHPVTDPGTMLAAMRRYPFAYPGAVPDEVQDDLREAMMEDVQRAPKVLWHGSTRSQTGHLAAHSNGMRERTAAERAAMLPEILRMRRKGMTIEAIARVMKKGASTISTILKEVGMAPGRQGQNAPKNGNPAGRRRKHED